jgi:hypothetical protein
MVAQVIGSIGGQYDCSDPKLVTGTIHRLDVVRHDVDQDLALLKIRSASGGPYNYVRVCRETNVPVGSDLVAVHFPLGQEKRPQPGTLSTKAGPRGFWETDAALNPGSSGAPVFTAEGRLIGVVLGGLSGADGMKYIVPIQHAFDLFLSANAPIEQCRTEGGDAGEADNCDWIVEDYDVDFKRNEHSAVSPTSGVSAKEYPAREGYLIKSWDWNAQSVNNATPLDVQILSEGRAIRVSSSLTSGPFFDRWRGWLSGKLITKQQLASCTQESEALK